jgi:ribose transport system permease protein
VGNVFGVPISVVIWMLIAGVCHFILRKTQFGQTLVAVGENELVARLSGLSVRFCKTGAYVLSAVLAGLTGIILTARLSSAQPVMGESWEFDAIACAVVGGTSLMGGVVNIVGVVLGTLIITVIRTGLNMMGMPGEIQSIAIGVLLILVVGFDMAKHRRIK